MGRLMIVNGSPRAPRSNSKQYAQIFREFFGGEVCEYEVTKRQHVQACAQAAECTDMLLVFPLYADGLPVTLMHFLKQLAQQEFQAPPTVHVLVNCGFLEPRQNDVACDMVRLFCTQHGFPFGSVLRVGSGEAILTTPFAGLVKRKLKKLAQAVEGGRPYSGSVTMPLPAWLYVRASAGYWLQYGAKNSLGKEQMATMQIESGAE